MKKLLLALLFISATLIVNAQNYTISTVAGGGEYNATNAKNISMYLLSVFVDDSDNIYITDPSGVYKVNTTGIIYTIAGNNFVTGYNGDKLPAIQAKLKYPYRIAKDKHGNIYIPDSWNNRIRKVSPSGIITTFSGTGTAGYNGDNIPASAAELNFPDNIVIDKAGNMYVGDESNGRLRKIDTSGIITTLYYTGGGSGLGQFAMSDSGAIYLLTVASSGGATISKIYKGVTTHIAGNGTATYGGNGGLAISAGLSGVTAIAVDRKGSVYISDNDGIIVQKIDSSGIINQYTNYFFWDQVSSICFDSANNMYVAADNGPQNTGQLVKVDPASVLDTIMSGVGVNRYIGNGGSAKNAILKNIEGLNIDTKGNLYVADEGNYFIRKIDTHGIISSIAGNGNEVLASSDTAATVAATTGLYEPEAVAVDKYGNVYIGDGNYTIHKIDTNGITTIYAGLGGVDSTCGGDGKPARKAELTAPSEINFDIAGNLYFSDWYVNRVREINSTTTIIHTVAGSGYVPACCSGGYSGDGGPATAAKFFSPRGSAVDDSGNVYIADTWNNVIRKVDTKGIVHAFAGNGYGAGSSSSTQYGGYTGDGGQATAAELFLPASVATDDSGNVFICDQGNHCVRMVNHLGIISTIAGNGKTANVPLSAISNAVADTSQLGGPRGITWERATNNIYFGDECFVYKLTKCGVIAPKVIIGDTVLCAGTITTYYTNKVAGAASYNWVLPQGWSGSSTDTSILVQAGSVGGNINVFAVGACSSSPQTISVRVIKIQILTVTPIDTFICIGSSMTLTAKGAKTYTWSPSTNLSSVTDSVVVANPSSTITYTVTGSYSNGCINKDTIVMNVSTGKGFDLTGSLSACIDTPGFNNAELQACIFNNRCLPVTGTIKILTDTAFHWQYYYASQNIYTNGDTLIWTFDSLSNIYSSQCIWLWGSVDTLPANDSIPVSMFITPMTGDSVPTNNTITEWIKPFPHNCVGLPFDPNGKQVSPEGNISTSQLLTYTIHFQNTGTAPAKNVLVIDTLSPYLDPTTIKVISGSYDVQTSIVAGHIVKFTFADINLPDTTIDKASSIVQFQYTIMPLSSDPIGDIITNHAGIYFDANPVINTNTTVNTINNSTVSIQNIVAPLNMACFPNPFTVSTSIVFNTDVKHYLEIDDVTGRRIENLECTGKQFEFLAGNLAKGIYFIRAVNEGNTYFATLKLVLQ